MRRPVRSRDGRAGTGRSIAATRIDTASSARLFWSLSVGAALVVVAFVVWVHFEIGGATTTTWVNDLTELAAAVAASLACLWAARQRYDPAGVDLAGGGVGGVGGRAGRVVVVRAANR